MSRRGCERWRRFAASGIALCAALWIVQPRAGAIASEQAAELGVVQWQRDFEAGSRRASAEGKPIFLLFQEVPGCSTCVGFGRTVLSHPLLVEAIESEFVPVAIYNNAGGADREVLDRFEEPPWNNPVVRFVAAGGDDLIPRADRVWTRSAVAARMVRALETSGRPVPPYLALLAGAVSSAGSGRATLAMDCFWTGEACLGGLDGVRSTRPGWLGSREVVEVRFDPARLSYGALLRYAKQKRCADQVFAHDASQVETAHTVFGERVTEASGGARSARDTDDKRHLRRSPYAQLDLTPAQQTRVNAALADGSDPRRWLSPRQRSSLPRATSLR